MEPALRPMSLGEILDRTVQVYRKRFLAFVGIAAVPYALALFPLSAFLLLEFWFGSSGTGLIGSTGSSILIGVGVFVAVPVWIAAAGLSIAALNHAAWQCHLGEGTTIRGAYRDIWARGWNYVGLFFLQCLLIGGVPAGAGVVMIMAGTAVAVTLRGSMGMAASMVLGLLAGVVFIGIFAYVIWMMLRISLAFPAAVVEQSSATDALGRSATLSKGGRGRIFVMFLLVGVLNYLISIAVTLPLVVAVAAIPGLKDPAHLQTMLGLTSVMSYSVSFAAQALVMPIFAIAILLFYFDQRIRKEGFDIEWMMLRAGLVVPEPASPPAQPWSPATPEGTATQPPAPPQSEEPA